MKFKQEIIIFLLLVFLFFSISVVSATESLDDSSTDELVLLSTNNELVNAIDNNIDAVQGNDSADLQKTAETDESTNKQNQKNVLGASNVEETPLRATSDVVHASVDYPNGGTFANLRTLINSVRAGGTLYLDGRTFNQTSTGVIKLEKSITIIGGNDTHPEKIATLNGKNKSRIFWAEGDYNIDLKNLKLINGYITGASDGIVGSGLVLKNVRSANVINVTVDNCNFVKNEDEAEYVVYIRATEKFNVENCTFSNMYLQAKTHAGVTVGIYGPLGQIKNCSFINNTVNVTSGTQKTAAAGLQVSTYDTAINPKHQINITGCYFENNVLIHAKNKGHGGALCMASPNTYCFNSIFINNKADEGGATTLHSSGTVYNCIFINNTATSLYGGAISTGYEDTTSTLNVNITECYFEGNEAPIGGAVQLKGQNIQIYDSEFYNNSAVEGGACYIQGNKAIIENSTFKENNATYNLSDEVTTISSSYRTMGAAVYILGSNSKILNNTFELNNATPKLDENVHGVLVYSDDCLGGAIYVKGDNTVTNGNDFINNTARNGSAIYTDGLDFQLTNDTFYHNQAYSYLLMTTAEPYETYYKKEPVNITVVHRGGDNIINAIYNKAAFNQIKFLNVSYTKTNQDGSDEQIHTNQTSTVKPVNGVEASQNGTYLYQDSREAYQNITFRLFNNFWVGGVNGNGYYLPMFVTTGSNITDIYGKVTITLSNLTPNRDKGEKLGYYTLYATHPEDWNYKYISNRTTFRVLPFTLTPDKTVSNETPFINSEIEYNLTIGNDADAVYSDKGYQIKAIYEHIGGE